MVADAALGRPAAKVVLHAVAREDLDGAVVHVDGKVDGQFPARFTEDPPQARVKAEAIGGDVELELRNVPWIDRSRDLLGGHADVLLVGPGGRPEPPGV